MARNQNTARKVQPEIGEAQAAPTKTETAKDKLGATAAKEKVRNIFDLESIEYSKTSTAVEKTKILTEVRQELAEAADLAADSFESNEEAKGIANRCGLKLYQAQIDGLVSKDEVSSTLGDIFGFRKKGAADTKVNAGDKDASKTPFGLGEHIRKRVVRAVAAHEHLQSRTVVQADGTEIEIQGDGGRFFETLPREAVEPIVEGLAKGEKTLWSAYDELTKMKAEGRQTVEAAFDPAKVAKLVEALEAEGAVDRMAASSDLQNAYRSLVAVLHEIGVEIAERQTA